MRSTSVSSTSVGIARPFTGLFFMLSSSIVFTIMNILIKTIDARYTAWHLGFFRFLGGVILLNLVFAKGGNLFKGDNIPLLLGRGCTGTVAFISLVTAMRMLPLSTSIIIFYTFPVFAAISAFFLYKERICLSQMFCIALVILGILVLFNFNISGSWFGQSMALTSAVFTGLTVTLIRSLRGKNGPVVIYLFFCIVGSIITFPMVALNPVIPSSLLEFLMIAGIILTSAGAQLLMNQGFFYCSGWEGGVYMSTEAVFTSLTGILLMGEIVSWNFFVGGMLILGSGVLLNYFKRRLVFS